ncbi:histidine phosphatase family protein, partial [Pseudomonas sp. HY13-MNA-CIBAN-0226]
MKMILIRHGQAEDETRPDSARQLTDFGQQQAAQTAKYITTNYKPDRFIVSPYDRAQQTLAELQARAPTVPATVQDNITPSDDAHS